MAGCGGGIVYGTDVLENESMAVHNRRREE